MEKKKWILLLCIIIIVALAGLGIIFFASNKVGDKNGQSKNEENGQVAGTSTQTENKEHAEKLAKYLNQQGMVLYGAYWCPHCKDQKALFGDAAQFLDYVECDAKGEGANPDECLAKGIESYPTWIYKDKKYLGSQSLEELAKIVGFDENQTAGDNSVK